MYVMTVEDDTRTSRLLEQGLTEAGHVVTSTDCGEDALALSRQQPFDAIVLDVSLPDIDGYETCRRLREAGDNVSVLMLTARGTVPDRVCGLDAGADDYLTKPYHLDELLARLRALSRRTEPDDADLLQRGQLRLDVDGALAWRGTEAIHLSALEARMLGALMRARGRVLTRGTIAELAWEEPIDLNSNVVDVHIRSLRSKIDEPFGVHSIETVRGLGYRLRSDGGS